MRALRLAMLALALGTGLTSYAQITNPAPYCVGSYDDANGFLVPHYISNVSFGTLSNNTGTNQYAAPHYAYYNTITAPSVAKGSTYALSVSHSAGASIHFLAVYIDFNKNNSFADPGERVLQQTINGAVTNPATANVVIPASAVTGTTRMRVMVFEDDDYTWVAGNLNASPCTTDATGTFDWGETEDYNINITGGGPAIPLPTAAFTAAPTTTNINSTVAFTDNSTGTPTSWKWTYTPNTVTFVNGTSNTSANPQVQFTAAGNYTAKLVVFNAGGGDSLTQNNYIQVNAGPSAPVAAFTANPVNGTVATSIALTDQSLNLPTAWKWAFTPNTVNYQNGTNSASKNPVVKCTVPGVYAVQLVVTNALGKDSVTKTGYLNITSVPLVDFMAASTTGTTTSTIVFYDMSSVMASRRKWSFSPATIQYAQGSDSSSATAVRFMAPGVYSVKLTVEHGGKTDSAVKTDYIHIVQAPTGLEEWVSVKENLVYPNPAHEKLYLNPALEGADIGIFDVSGREVARFSGVAGSITLPALQRGVYFLRIAQHGQTLHHKLKIEP